MVRRAIAGSSSRKADEADSVGAVLIGLHPLERKLLSAVAQAGKGRLIKHAFQFDELARAASLKDVEAMRAMQWLSNKKAVKIDEGITSTVVLGENGRRYLKEGLPERRLLMALKTSAVKGAEGDKAARHAGQSLKQTDWESRGLSREELGASIGVLKKKQAIAMERQDNDEVITLTGQGRGLLEKPMPEEEFLRTLPRNEKSLKQGERQILEELKRRKDIIIVETRKAYSLTLTSLGERLADQLKEGLELAERLTPEMLRTGSWKKKGFRAFDVKAKLPEIYGGRKQHYRAFLDEVKQRFAAMGFIEMTGPIVESEFWDMDVLFMPQFHSARDIHDAYYVKGPKYADDLPKELVKRVAASHEHGEGTASRGWRYRFDLKRTARLLLRTQGTALSARTLASKELKIPGRYFAIARCFRYDVIDATHNCDFFQTEGIVVEEGLTIKHLFGLLEMFAREFADADEIKITPAYFPFTEPSATLYARHPELGWIELGGSGIFRPEMTKPLGIEQPVIAWGIGIDRIAMFRLGITDIRTLFSNDLEFLRKQKVI